MGRHDTEAARARVDEAKAARLPRLTATALSAYLILDWVIRAHQSGQLPFPLATCRLLLSPTPSELQKAPPIGNEQQPYRPTMAQLGAPRCTLKSLRDAAAYWRADAETRSDAATLFYFAGHGIQRSRGDQILLLEDFASSPLLLEYAVDVSSLRDGMAPTTVTRSGRLCRAKKPSDSMPRSAPGTAGRRGRPPDASRLRPPVSRRPSTSTVPASSTRPQPRTTSTRLFARFAS